MSLNCILPWSLLPSLGPSRHPLLISMFSVFSYYIINISSRIFSRLVFPEHHLNNNMIIIFPIPHHCYSSIQLVVWVLSFFDKSYKLGASSASMKMVQQSRKTIVVTEHTFETLRKMGTVTESFNDVIARLIQNQKAAMSGQSLAGSSQNKAAAPLSTNGVESSNE